MVQQRGFPPDPAGEMLFSLLFPLQCPGSDGMEEVCFAVQLVEDGSGNNTSVD